MKIPIVKTALMLMALTALTSEGLAQGHHGGNGRGNDFDYGRGGRGQRQQQFVINMNDQVFAGGRHGRMGSMIGLKRLIKSQYPMVNLRDKKLVEVKLVAKSARGMGSAELLIGGQRVDDQSVQIFMGRRSRDLRDAFQNGGRRTFDRVFLAPWGRRQQTMVPWKLNLRGRIKVRRIKVTVQSQRHCRGMIDRRGRCRGMGDPLPGRRFN